MTVLEGIQRSAEFLGRKGVDSPRLQAELLLAHVLKLERMRLYLNFERVLSEQEAETFKALVIRRANREPLQLILSSTCFCGLEIAVNRHVLIPRPETELLAEKAWESLRVQSTKYEVQSPSSERSAHALKVLDLGTGSGCLAIAIAKNCPGSLVVASDVSPEALECAKENALRNSVSERIDFRLGDGFAALSAGERFDLIVSNPPYIPSAEIASLQPEVRDWEPKRALDGGPDGLDWYRRIATEGREHLMPSGKALFEFGDGQTEAVSKIFQQEKWIVEAVLEDYNRRPRIVVVKREE